VFGIRQDEASARMVVGRLEGLESFILKGGPFSIKLTKVPSGNFPFGAHGGRSRILLLIKEQFFTSLYRAVPWDIQGYSLKAWANTKKLEQSLFAL
jgi:hypothetical protein